MPDRLYERCPQHGSATNDEVIEGIQHLEIEERTQGCYGHDTDQTSKQCQDQRRRAPVPALFMLIHSCWWLDE